MCVTHLYWAGGVLSVRDWVMRLRRVKGDKAQWAAVVVIDGLDQFTVSICVEG